MMVVVVLHFLASYSKTILKFVSNVLTLILFDNCFEFHMFVNCRDDSPALPILAFMPVSDSPCSLMMLSRYVEVFTFSRVSPSSVIELMSSVLYLRVLLFPLCMLWPTDAEVVATLFVFTFICWCV
ncbi:unnamed protein product [Schistosoma curassoni]|nr:unnamed protein product [Schistosoma curassoni]